MSELPGSTQRRGGVSDDVLHTVWFVFQNVHWLFYIVTLLVLGKSIARNDLRTRHGFCLFCFCFVFQKMTENVHLYKYQWACDCFLLGVHSLASLARVAVRVGCGRFVVNLCLSVVVSASPGAAPALALPCPEPPCCSGSV